MVIGGLGVGLLSKKAGCLRRVRPLLLGSPLSFRGLSLEGTNWGDSWVECDLWRSRAGAERCRGTSLHLPVVMHAVYWSTEESRLPKGDVRRGWGSSRLTVVTITNVNSTRTRACAGGVNGYDRGSELGSSWGPIIGICTGSWGAGSGSGINRVPVMVLDLDIVRKGPYVFKAGLILSFSSLGVRLCNG